MTVYAIFCRWVRTGAWQIIHDCLREMLRVADGRHHLPSAAIIDAQSVPGADTVSVRTRGHDAGKKINGRKRHIAVDTTGLLLAIVVHVASIQDADGGVRVLTALRATTSLWCGPTAAKRPPGHFREKRSRTDVDHRQTH